MKKLSTANISNTVAMPIKGGTLDFVQLAYQEVIDAIVKNIIGGLTSPTSYYILYGCKNTGSGSNYIIGAGAIYYNGEVYLVPAATFTAASGQVAVGTITTNYYATNADPVLFTDGVSRNVHQIRTINFASDVSGSGSVDLTGLINTPLTLKNEQIATMPSTYTVFFDQDRAVFFGSVPASPTITFDFTNAIPGNVLRLKFTFATALSLTVTAPSGCTVINDNNATASGAGTYLFYCTYLGKNAAGNDEVSYILKSV